MIDSLEVNYTHARNRNMLYLPLMFQRLVLEAMCPALLWLGCSSETQIFQDIWNRSTLKRNKSDKINHIYAKFKLRRKICFSQDTKNYLYIRISIDKICCINKLKEKYINRFKTNFIKFTIVIYILYIL